jgi:hypothetical protein
MLYFKLATYERLESVSLLELALWQVKIDSCKAAYETDHQRDEASSPKRPRLDKSHIVGVDRQSCRINSGTDVVISKCCLFWTMFVERTTLRWSLPLRFSDLAIHKCLALVVINRVLPVDDITIGL